MTVSAAGVRNRVAQHFGQSTFVRLVKFGPKQHDFQPSLAIGLLAEEQQLSKLIWNLIARDIFARGQRRTIEQ